MWWARAIRGDQDHRRRRAGVLGWQFAGDATVRGELERQVLLGHAKLETTALYTRVAVNTIRDIKSPLERLGVNLASRSPPA